MEVNNFDSYIIHIYIYYIHTYIYILCTWVCPTMRQCTTCINLNRENNDQPWGFRMYDMTFFWTNSYTHPDLVWVMLVVFNNSEDVWSICFDSPPAAKKTHDSKMPSKNFDNSYPLPFLNTWGANRLNAPRCLERCWSSREVVSQIEPAEVAKRFQHLHLRCRFLVSKNFQRAEMTSLAAWLPKYQHVTITNLRHVWSFLGKQTKSSPTSENKLWSSWLYPKYQI